jgi:prepilin-type N-terminal cleavage/methylation domain-containing protein
MQRTRPVPERAGFTLLEMMIAVTLTVIVFGLAVPFFRAQILAMDKQAGRADAGRNAAYGVNQIDKDLRNAGVNMPDSQPMLVRVARDAITFNGDLVTKLETGYLAVYSNKNVDSGAVAALNPSERGGKITLPNSSVSYPDAWYRGDAETTSYFLARPAGATRSDVYNLVRKVNRLPEEVVARSIVVPSGESPFRYFKSDSVGGLQEIPPSALPLHHSAAIHESGLDVGPSALTDSIVMVRVRLIGMYEDPRGGEMRDTVERSIRIMNAGLLHLAQCGDRPPFDVSVRARRVGGGTPGIEVEWPRATDDGGNEKDVMRYALYRRLESAPDFGEPIATVPATGASKYTFKDVNLTSGRWVYGVAAQDCTPKNSDIRQAPAVLF